MSAVLLAALLATQPTGYEEAPPPASPLARLGARMGVEFAVGPYRPDVDGEFAEATPYADVFGQGSTVMYRLRLHGFVPTALGELGLTVGIGWFTDSANALAEDGSESAGDTGIRLIPLSLLARWRTEGLSRWPGMPFALSAGGGVSYTLWRISRGDGGTAEFEGIEGTGGTLSVQLEAAVGLRLGQLDRRAAKVLREQFGIDDTEVGVAVTYTSPPVGWWDALSLGDLTWQGYLTVAF